MAGDKNIYVVYDPKIEDSSSLSKFLGIVLDKAKYPIKLVEFITLEDYLKLVETNGPRNFTICLNKTYSDVSLKYGSILEEATFKFFSRYYQNPEKGIAILGLLTDVSEIFSNDASKKNAWGKLVTLQKFYTEHSSGFESKVITKTVIEEPVKEVKEEVEDETSVISNTCEVLQAEEVVVQEQTTEPTPEKKRLVIKDCVPQKQEGPSYEELLAFYTIVSRILKDVHDLKKLDHTMLVK